VRPNPAEPVSENTTKTSINEPGSWWRTAVIYEIYPRSFADGNNDGVGDIAGMRSRLPYLAELGVDAIWIAPWYPSPMKDGGYDIADYCDIDPVFGRLVDAQGLFDDARALGIKVILDFVPNHTSDQHPMFQAALKAPAGSEERDRYFFRDGNGPSGDEPPNDWISAFGGRAWTRLANPDGSPGQWYLHLFAPEQPDVNWENRYVQEMFDDVIRFWFDLGVDGLRVDAAPAMGKKAGLPDAGHGPGALFAASEWIDNPHWDVDDLHQTLRRWRKIGDKYAEPKVFVSESIVNGPERLSRYVRPDEMHATFNFDYLKAGWSATRIRNVIDSTLEALVPVAAPATWVLSSHDETRHLTRYGRTYTAATVLGFAGDIGGTDLALGTKRARAAALLTLALPGGAYIYQGEELGLPEVEDLPEHLLQDPAWERSGHRFRGRDGCRVPLPWSGARSPFGFSAADVRPWLPQPANWQYLTADAQRSDPTSMLSLYRNALELRRKLPGWGQHLFTWLDSPRDVLSFERGDGLRCVVNLSRDDYQFGSLGQVLLSSIQLDRACLPTDCAVWLRAG
jgi:alpha-glucosidase